MPYIFSAAPYFLYNITLPKRKNMTVTSNDCKQFIAQNAPDEKIPSSGWKRVSKSKNEDGCWIRIFEHGDGYRVHILEDKDSSDLVWLKTENNKQAVVNNIVYDSEDENIFSQMPKAVKLYINSLRSLQGNEPLLPETFSKKHQKMWAQTISDRLNSPDASDLPSIMLFDAEYSDEIWSLLNVGLDSSWDNEHVIKYVATYFWFAFANDPRDTNENPFLLITPKGFWDDGRVQLIFTDYPLHNDLVKGLHEIMESTLELEPETTDPLEQLREAVIKMKNLGISFSQELQESQICHLSKESGRDFTDPQWRFENLVQSQNKKKVKP